MSLKRLGTLMMLMAIALVVTAAAYAQGSTDQAGTSSRDERHEAGRYAGPPSPATELERLSQTLQASRLPLTDTQKVAILGIYEDRETVMHALRQHTADGAIKAQEVQALMDSNHASVRAALTEPQARIFDMVRPPAPPKDSFDAEVQATSQEGQRPSGTAARVSFAYAAAPGGNALNDDSSLIDANTGGAPESSPAQ